MRYMTLGSSSCQVPVIAVGCMRLPSLEPARAERFIHAALDYGLNFFDHADIYGRGQAEERFAQAFRTTQRARDTIIVQSKCGIRPGLYDLSQEHILQAVDGSLRRLKTDYLDILLLHRPDALVEPEEVARAFDALKESGKVRYFGVSNHKPMQIELLKQSVRQPLIVNQLQLGVAHANMIAQGMNVNMLNDSAPDRDGHVLDYCRLNRITIQPWSPFQHGFFQGVFFDQPEFEKLNQTLEQVAQTHNVSKTAVALAWLLRHPARMQPVVGTMNTEHLQQCADAADIWLSREEWYAIYRAAGYPLP